MKLKIIFVLFMFGVVNFSASQSISESFLLPNTTKPESYIVIISTNVPGATRRFTGDLLLTIKVLQATHEVILHSRQHTITEFHLFDSSNTELNHVALTRVNSDVIKVSSTQELRAGLSYNLVISYQGNLLLDSDGFFRSDYVVDVNGSDIFT